MTERLDDIPQKHRKRFVEIVELTDRFCAEHLNGEYQQTCREMAAAACRADLPVQRGKPESWAGGIVHAVGFVNFLSDPGTEPHRRPGEIAQGLGVSMATMQAKSKAIRDALDIVRFDPDFTVPSLIERNPLAWMVETGDGLIIDIRHAPRAVQEEAFSRGLIPYVPGEPEESEGAQRRAELRSRYQHLRRVSMDLNRKLVKRLSKDAINEAGRALGMVRGEALVCDPDVELPVLMDYCIFHVRRNGRTAVEQYLVDSPPEAGSDEMACLRAMQQGLYSVFVVEQVEPGLGVAVRNLLSQETFLVADMGLGNTARAGLMLASRMLFFDEFAATGGAALPVVVPPGENREKWIERLLTLDTPQGSGFSDPAPIIRECLTPNESLKIRYT